MSLTPGARVGPYEIISALGAGGMGEVYRAKDTKLGRHVALKVLPADMACEPDRLARFQREARAVAALNHPNIVTIHSVEEIGGTHFLTMELVEGQTLAELIAPGLSLPDTIRLATQIADALASAHEKGIVHRDLKPANVMVTRDGRLKVLDFGLAKETRAADPGDATRTSGDRTEMGVVMGTPAYMSPEQVTGRTVDHRTDIFSLGIVLYEMVSGARPFAGATPIELASSILRDDPRPVGDVCADVPVTLTRVTQRCLEKDPQRRIQTAREVADALRDSVTGAPKTPAVRFLSTEEAERQADCCFGVTVATFKYTGSNADVSALADGLPDEIITGLSRFSYLRVLARGSAKEASARYRIDGSLRQAGTMLRVAAQLVDTETGSHLWADTYDRPFRAEDIFALQDDLVPRIVSTVADLNGVLCRSMCDALRGRRPESLTAYEAVVRAAGHNDRVTKEEHAEVRDVLEHAVRVRPEASDCWAFLACTIAGEFSYGFNPRPDPLGRALEAARRAVDTGPASQAAYYAQAMVLFFRKDLVGFRYSAERAIALNPMNSSVTAHIGILLAYSGDWARGCAVIERAAQLSPQHPTWYWFGASYDAFRQGKYQTALEIATRIDMPHFYAQHIILAATHAELGNRAAAHSAVGNLLALVPNYGAIAMMECDHWHWNQPEVLARLIDGLRKAGLEIAPEAAAESAVSKPTTAVKPSIAVLPFVNMSGDREQDYFSDGLADEIINALVKIPGLKVTARTSAFAFKGQNTDVRKIAEALGVANILEGSVRRAGDRIRVTAQLVTATDGSHLWSERYDRELADVFAVQDEISASIAKALSVTLAPATPRYTPNIAAYEAYLKGHHFQFQLTQESLALAKIEYARAIALDPDFAMARIGQADYFLTVGAIGLMPAREAMPLMREHARRALEIDPSLAEAHAMLGIVAGVHDYDWPEADRRFQQALALAPESNWVRSWRCGFFMMWVGRPTEGIQLVQESLRDDPLNTIFRWNFALALLAAGRLAEGVSEFRQMLEIDPEFWYACYNLAMIHVAAGELDKALTYARRARAIVPFAPQVAGLLAGLLKRSGDVAGADAIVGDLRAEDNMVPTGLAIYHFVAGDIAESARWIDRAIDARDPQLVSVTCLSFGQPFFSSAHWPPLAARMNLPASRAESRATPQRR